MTNITERPKVGIGCVVIRDIDDAPRVLMGVRKGAHGAGELSFPGGKPEGAETLEQAAIRELREETGLVAHAALPLGFWSYDRYDDEGFHYVTLYFICLVDDDQAAVLSEPDKCEGWEWYDPHALPGDPGAFPRDAVFFSGVADALRVVI